jgi:hypothetical protein
MGKSGSEPVPGGTSLTLLSQCRDEAQLGMSPQKSKAQKQSTKAKRKSKAQSTAPTRPEERAEDRTQIEFPRCGKISHCSASRKV